MATASDKARIRVFHVFPAKANRPTKYRITNQEQAKTEKPIANFQSHLNWKFFENMQVAALAKEAQYRGRERTSDAINCTTSTAALCVVIFVALAQGVFCTCNATFLKKFACKKNHVRLLQNIQSMGAITNQS